MVGSRILRRAIVLGVAVADAWLLYFGVTSLIPDYGVFGLVWLVVVVLASVSGIMELLKDW